VVYGSGGCNIFYCRITDPDGLVLSGHPNGDANCDRTTNSLDALVILQYVAALIPDVPCPFQAYVDREPGLGASDALAILQAEAGLIPGLPLPL